MPIGPNSIGSIGIKDLMVRRTLASDPTRSVQGNRETGSSAPITQVKEGVFPVLPSLTAYGVLVGH